jgi:4'-phosphopantetheinyl transferase
MLAPALSIPRIQRFQFPDDVEQALRLRAAPNEVHVWLLNAAKAPIDSLSHLLSEEESVRANKIRVSQAREEFIAGRAGLRLLLSRYLHRPPGLLRFAYTRHEKPMLADPSAPVAFNVSHSGGLVLIAITAQRRIGIDIEFMRQDFDVIAIAERFFSPAERKTLRARLAHDAANAFFRCWTRKEAFIKALGEGLSHPLHTFDVDFEAGQSYLLGTRPDSEEAKRWLLFDVAVPQGYAAALAVEAQQAVSSTE